MMPSTPVLPETLHVLIGRIAAGDRAALRTVYAALADIVTAEVRRALSDPAEVHAAVCSTFVEVWWLARFHTGRDADIPAWIAFVAGQRAAERRRATASPEPGVKFISYDPDISRVALAGLLGHAVPVHRLIA
jgi:DNA-directed RNA polymerase specialized sigma24 family protein